MQELEQYILADLIEDNSNFSRFFLSEDYFSILEHKAVMKEITHQMCSVGECSILSLTNALPEIKEVKSFLSKLVINNQHAASFKHLCGLLKKNYEREKLKEIISHAQKAIDSGIENHVLIESMEKSIYSMHNQASQYRVIKFSDAIKQSLDRINSADSKITPTGLQAVDISMNGGLESGRSYCFAGRPKAGKTMFKTTIANHLRKNNVNFLFIAAEMSAMEIAKRMVGQDNNQSVMKYHERIKSEEGIQQLIRQLNDDTGTMKFIDAPRITLDALVSSVNNAVRNYGIEGFVLDYLQLVSGKSKDESKVDHQENVAQTIAELCKKHNIWCLYSCQLNREGTVRGGDGIVMAADWVYEIARIGEEGRDPTNEFYLKHVVTRSSAAKDIGNENEPSFELSKTGTHFLQLFY